MPAEQIAAVQHFASLNPDHSICVWCFELEKVAEVRNLRFSNIHICFVDTLRLPEAVMRFLTLTHDSGRYAAGKDIVQLWVLFEIGGHFFDLDVRPFSIATSGIDTSMKGILVQDFFQPPAMSAMRAHPIFQHLCQQSEIRSNQTLLSPELKMGFAEYPFASVLLTGSYLNLLAPLERAPDVNEFFYPSGVIEAYCKLYDVPLMDPTYEMFSQRIPPLAPFVELMPFLPEAGTVDITRYEMPFKGFGGKASKSSCVIC